MVSWKDNKGEKLGLNTPPPTIAKRAPATPILPCGELPTYRYPVQRRGMQ
jgi:hypothetical protein